MLHTHHLIKPEWQTSQHHLILGVLEKNAKERYLFKQFWSYYLVIRCQPRLYAPAGGIKHCTMDNMYGSECFFTCQPGHIMRGSAKRSCETNHTSSFGFWTGNETKCECKLYQFHYNLKFSSLSRDSNFALHINWNNPLRLLIIIYIPQK